MIGDNTIATLQKYGTVTQDDLTNIEQLLTKWYTPTEAVAFMIQNNPTRFTTQESKTPNIQTYEVNGEKYSWYFDEGGNFVNMSAPWGWGGGWNTPSTDAVSLISKWEWFRDKAYQDSAWVWTVWFGFTNLNGRSVKPWDTIDRASAEKLLQKEISQRQNFMNYITVPLNENQKAALASFEYNLWSGIWEKNAMWILNKVNQWDLAWAASIMKQYVNAWGKPIKWLVNRRNEEASLLTQTPQAQWSKEYSESQQNMMRQMDAKNISSTEKTMLKKAWLTEEDVYNYKNSRTSDRRQNGLNDDEIKRVNSMADDFYWTPTAKTFNKIQEAYKFADSIKWWVKATDNQALIYAFAKAMDPDSVVREGEYSTVQKYSQTWWDKLGMDINRVLNGQEFISEKAKNNIVSTIKSKYDATKSQYEQERKTYINRINDYAWNDIWGKVIPSNAIIEEQVKSDIPEWLANPSSWVVSQAAKNLLNDL